MQTHFTSSPNTRNYCLNSKDSKPYSLPMPGKCLFSKTSWKSKLRVFSKNTEAIWKSKRYQGFRGSLISQCSWRAWKTSFSVIKSHLLWEQKEEGSDVEEWVTFFRELSQSAPFGTIHMDQFWQQESCEWQQKLHSKKREEDSLLLW